MALNPQRLAPHFPVGAPDPHRHGRVVAGGGGRKEIEPGQVEFSLALVPRRLNDRRAAGRLPVVGGRRPLADLVATAEAVERVRFYRQRLHKARIAEKEGG